MVQFKLTKKLHLLKQKKYIGYTSILIFLTLFANSIKKLNINNIKKMEVKRGNFPLFNPDKY